jgi:hypothetical protein
MNILLSSRPAGAKECFYIFYIIIQGPESYKVDRPKRWLDCGLSAKQHCLAAAEEAGENQSLDHGSTSGKAVTRTRMVA